MKKEVNIVYTIPFNSFPEAYRLAEKFHNLYEEASPQFGYETRKDTKKFDPNSNNGRLMAYVCYTIVQEELNKQ